MTKEEKVREEINNLYMTLFDAADKITILENDGKGDLAVVFDEVGRQVEYINSAISRYLEADSEYTQELEYPDGYCD